MRSTIWVAVLLAALALSSLAEDDEDRCEAIAGPSDGEVFEDGSPEIFFAVGECFRVPETYNQEVKITIELRPSTRVYNFNVLAPDLQRGQDLRLPVALPDASYEGFVRIAPPYNLALSLRFTVVSSSRKQLKVVFPVPGFAFGSLSTPWVQVLVTDDALASKGVREVNYFLQLSVNGRPPMSIPSPNGRRIELGSGTSIGENRIELEVLDILRRPLGLSTSFTLNISSSPEDSFASPPGSFSSEELHCGGASGSCRSPEDCSGHGECGRGGYCECGGDWAGYRCEHNMLFSPSFLPESDPLLSESRCHGASSRLKAVADLLQSMGNVMNPGECQVHTTFLQEFKGTRGLGITWRWLSLALNEAIVHRKALVVDGKWPWFDFEGCEDGVFCYLQPLSNCTNVAVRKNFALLLALNKSAGANERAEGATSKMQEGQQQQQQQGEEEAEEEKEEAALSHLHPATRRRLRTVASDLLDLPMSRRSFNGSEQEELEKLNDWDLEGQVPQVLRPPKSIGKTVGVLWWNSFLTEQILRPSRFLDAHLRHARNAVNFQHPILGIHVRHGDACSDWSRPRACRGLSEYVEAAEEMRRRYGVTRIFLATDSEDVKREFERLPNFSVTSLPGLDRQTFHSDLYIEFRVQMKIVDRKTVTHSSFLDLFLLAQCDYFVGTLSSAFSSVVLELSIAQKGYYPPFISLDIPWRPFRPFEPHPYLSMQHLVRD